MSGTRVPLVDLQAQYRPIRAEILAAVTRVCDSQQFILGQEVEALECELAALLQTRHAIGVSSGTDALLAVLMALGIGPGDEVVTSSYSFFASAGSVVRVGARPVFVDIDPTTYNIDPRAAAAALGPRTRAVLPVHLFGLSADLDPICQAAARADVPVVEDACQAIAAIYRGRSVGTIGLAGCFSFFPSKNLGGFGDGGLVTAADDELAGRIRALRSHGARRKYVHEQVGGNFRLDALQAAVIRAKRPHLARWTEARRANARRYQDLFTDAGLTSTVTLPVEPAGCLHVYHQYVIRAPRRDALRAHLADAGIATEVYYPVPLHLQKCFAHLGDADGAFPQAEAASRETLALPVYGELTEDQQADVVARIADFYRAPGS